MFKNATKVKFRSWALIFINENNLWSNLELKTKARDLNLTLMTFWILCNGHADSLGVKKQVEQKVPSP